MTSFVYPADIPGLTLEVARTPIWNTGVQTALSKKRSTIAWLLYPVIHFELKYELLRDDLATSELKELVGLFNACQGQFDTFLFTDPDFNSFASTNQQTFATGNGTAGPFQLTATYQNSSGPGYAEIIQNLNGTPVLYDNGSIISAANYSIGATGLVTFGATHFPVAGHVLTWSGAFYYRCAFDDDKLGNLAKIMNKWWDLSKIAFTSIKL